MDHSASQDQDIGSDIDLESGICVIHCNEEGSVDDKLEKTVFLKLCDRIINVDDSSIKSDMSSLNVNEGSLVNNVNLLMEKNSKRKKGSGAKKPPRPPRGLSLDGADQKLIKELAELAVMKRARIERMKALTQKKASKLSSSSSSPGSFFAMIFTIIFFLVILLQGQKCPTGFNVEVSVDIVDSGSFNP
uniref:Transmembrane protein, putative n=1 Tax=Tanacetum cinerariifolium TaxID=118510 RepID=A0A699JWK0_TANCI|nr:transmembrane protein, putative [Tanacetum cinerariifolium]